MNYIFTKTSARHLIFLVAKKHFSNQKKLNIHEIEGGEYPNRIKGMLWNVLHPANYLIGYKREAWKNFDENEKKKQIEKNAKQEEIDTKEIPRLYNRSCTYARIEQLVNLATNGSNGETYPPKDPMFFKQLAHRLELKENELKNELQQKEENNDSEVQAEIIALYNSNWWAYYRVRNTKTKKSIISKCKVTIDSKGKIEIYAPKELKNDYEGSMHVIAKQELELRLKHVDYPNDGYTYIKFSSPNLELNEEKELIFHGLFLQRHRKYGNIQSGSVLFHRTRLEQIKMIPNIIDITKTEKKSSIPSLPYDRVYETIEDKVRRLLFEEKRNFISTSKMDLSEKFNKQLREWDEKVSTAYRPIYDIYVSCPISKYREENDIEGFNRIKKKVMLIKELIKAYIKPINYQNVLPNELIAITPFDKMKKFRSFEDDKRVGTPIRIDLYEISQEIANSLLFVMYYPYESYSSSCLAEASWAIRCGVCCLFIVKNKEKLMRYLKKDSILDHYPIHIIEGGYDTFVEVIIHEKRRESIGSSLGDTIEFRKDDDPKSKSYLTENKILAFLEEEE